jgi:hypothetical protein
VIWGQVEHLPGNWVFVCLYTPTYSFTISLTFSNNQFLTWQIQLNSLLVSWCCLRFLCSDRENLQVRVGMPVPSSWVDADFPISSWTMCWCFFFFTGPWFLDNYNLKKLKNLKSTIKTDLIFMYFRLWFSVVEFFLSSTKLDKLLNYIRLELYN